MPTAVPIFTLTLASLTMCTDGDVLNFFDVPCNPFDDFEHMPLGSINPPILVVALGLCSGDARCTSPISTFPRAMGGLWECPWSMSGPWSNPFGDQGYSGSGSRCHPCRLCETPHMCGLVLCRISFLNCLTGQAGSRRFLPGPLESVYVRSLSCL